MTSGSLVLSAGLAAVKVQAPSTTMQTNDRRGSGLKCAGDLSVPLLPDVIHPSALAAVVSSSYVEGDLSRVP